MGLRDRLPVAWSGMAPVSQRRMDAEIARSGTPLSLDAYFQQLMVSYMGNQYGPTVSVTSPVGAQQETAADFAGYVQSCYYRNGVVAACLLARESLFSEARFQWRQRTKGRPGRLFGTPELRPVEEPWPNGTTGDLLGRMEQDSTIEGNFFGLRAADQIHRMRPDWVSIILGSNTLPEEPAFAVDAQPIGYAFHPGGYNSGRQPQVFPFEQVAHYAPRKDPTSVSRGISLLTSVLREIAADGAATDEKTRYFQDGGTPRTVAIVPIPEVETFLSFVNDVRERSRMLGPYEHLWLQQGVDFKTIGSTVEEMQLGDIQGAGETRIAAAFGVPPVIVGLSEGLKAATYSNYELAMRRFADLTMRPLWRNAAASLERILDKPERLDGDGEQARGVELWYDDRDIPALKDDIRAAAEAQGLESQTIRTLIDAGYLAPSVIDAVTAKDWTLLEHSGLFSVQLQPPNTEKPEPPPNGNGNPDGAEGDLAERARTILEERR